MAEMGQPETKVGDLCQELGVTRQTLYRHLSPEAALRPDGESLLGRLGQCQIIPWCLDSRMPAEQPAVLRVV